jgi:phage protein D/phage baseplate assembly protein gpV
MSTLEKIRSNEIASGKCVIKVGGSPIDATIMTNVIWAEVEQNIQLPSMFAVAFNNRKMQGVGRTFEIGDEIELSMGHEGNGQPLLKGELTSIELDVDGFGQPMTIIRGFDKLHRLQRGSNTRTFLQQKLSDLVAKLAQEAGLSGQAEDTGVQYEYILQNNETNFEFLKRRADRIGMELYVEGTALKLRKPATTEGPALTWGQNLQKLHMRKSAYDPVNEAVVRAWDPKTAQPIVGGKGGEAGKFGSSKMAAAYMNVTNQAEADKMAEAIHADLKDSDVTMEAICMGDPTLKPGVKVKVEKVGDGFEGKYYVTSCVHRYTAGGYTTQVVCSGKHPTTMLSLTDQSVADEQAPTVPGFVVGVVTNNKDAEGKMARVKVKFPNLPQDNGKDIESHWARIATPMAGSGRGLLWMPEVNDEVLVGFVNGDINQPYVVGALWNGQALPPAEAHTAPVISGSGQVEQRIFKTRVGHILMFDDTAGSAKITIIDKTTANKITIDSEQNTITVETTKDIVLKAPQGKIALEAMNVEVKATQGFKVNGATADVTASGPATYKGATVKIG